MDRLLGDEGRRLPAGTSPAGLVCRAETSERLPGAPVEPAGDVEPVREWVVGMLLLAAQQAGDPPGDRGRESAVADGEPETRGVSDCPLRGPELQRHAVRVGRARAFEQRPAATPGGRHAIEYPRVPRAAATQNLLDRFSRRLDPAKCFLQLDNELALRAIA